MERPVTAQGNPLNNTDIYETLFIFINDMLYNYKTSAKEKGENKITQDIEMDLREKARNNDTFFDFQNQHGQGNATTDIGVYLRHGKYFFCWVEAKRLPVPKAKNRDEREYVFVSQEKINGKKKFKGNGGIQRFKENEHADKLPFSIMIGYIQDGNSAGYWLKKINEWITELVNANTELWHGEDCLYKYDSNKCDRFLSSHERKDETTIILHHYWIKL
ncbi:MAG: hypothetical protein LBH60_02730 [Prevotellaceae bacterium]|jgi:hypothetical protein|nr:hypothetical protein [Prevotellaceae bacterium]